MCSDQPDDPPYREIRPAFLRRSWLFLPGAQRDVLLAGAQSEADVVIQELEDFTLPPERPRAHAIAGEVMAAWKRAGKIAAVRVNPFDDGGLVDLEMVMPGRPHIVALPKVRDAAQIKELDHKISQFERALGLIEGTTEILPNIEFARGVVNTIEIAEASPRVKACLLAAEDLAADLGAERGPDGIELTYCRQRFLVECRAANVVAVDCPYTWMDGGQYMRNETLFARRLGYKAKSCVYAPHVEVINEVFTPDREQVETATTLVQIFEEARGRGEDRAIIDGSLVELPTYMSAKRLLERAAQLAAYD